MKRIKIILLTTFLVLNYQYLLAQVTTTQNFQQLSVADGLVGDDITDVFIEDSINVWIATTSGLSHYDGIAFTNYTSQNSTLINNNLKELEIAQGKIWMVSDSGLSSFDGVTFINYTTSSGLLNANIEGLAVSSSDTLWLTSQSGTSKFDGNNFTHYSTQTGRDVEVDGMGRVYVMRSSVANNFPFARMYENGAWSLPSPTGINSGISGAKLIRTSEGNLYLGGINSTYFKISYPLNLTKREVYFDSTIHSSNSGIQINVRQLEESNGLSFIGGGSNVPFYHVSPDSNFVRQYVNISDAISSSIKIKGNILAIGSDKGLFLSTPTIKSSVTGLPFSINQISTSVSMTDPLFSNLLTNTANFEFPKNSNSHGIYSANFIVAAKKQNQSNYIVHPQNGFFAAFTPGPINNVGGLSDRYMFKLSKQEILNHQSNYTQPGYSMPVGISDWPAYGDSTLGIAKDLAPFVDVNRNGCYDPANGDYPIIKGDEAIYWINHPINQNLELEYHWMMYGFDQPTNKSLDQSIFLQYTIVNRADTAYDSLKVGFYLDGDLGSPVDDYVGSDSINNLLYFYNGDSFDDNFAGFNGYGNMAPALGVKFLSDSLDNAMYFNVGSAPNGDPNTPQDWLNYFNSRWKNGQHVTYGGDGFMNGSTTIPTKYMFAGDPATQTGWTEITPLSGFGSNPPGDRRMMGSIPYFSLQPGERKTIEIAVGYGQTSSTSSVIGKNVSEMRLILNGARSVWDTLSIPTETYATNDSCSVLTSISEISGNKKESLKLYPVPAKNQLFISFNEQLNVVKIYDMKGSLVKEENLFQNELVLDISDLKEGVYFLNAATPSGMRNAKFMIVR